MKWWTVRRLTLCWATNYLSSRHHYPSPTAWMCLCVLALVVSERCVPRESENINSKQICVFVLRVRFDIMSEVGGKWSHITQALLWQEKLYAFKQLMKNERDLSVINMRAFWPWLQTGLTGLLNFLQEKVELREVLKEKQQSCWRELRRRDKLLRNCCN